MHSKLFQISSNSRSRSDLYRHSRLLRSASPLKLTCVCSRGHIEHDYAAVVYTGGSIDSFIAEAPVSNKGPLG